MQDSSITEQDWREAERFLSSFRMTPQEFLRLHPGLNRKQLARIAGCSLTTVHHWFSEGESHTDPSEHHCLRLAIAHWYLVQKAARPPIFDELDTMINESKDWL